MGSSDNINAPCFQNTVVLIFAAMTNLLPKLVIIVVMHAKGWTELILYAQLFYYFYFQTALCELIFGSIL